ncbi:MAG: AAA family ATPase [Bacilli bacterium]|nr:AAA family ATPase [Bacilli bacterium]
MKISSLEIKDFPPIKNFKLENLGDIVIIAGANGSGKSRLKGAIVNTFQGGNQMSISLLATREKEKEDFQADTLIVKQGVQNPILMEYMNKRRFGRGQYIGSLVQIDSQRNIETTRYQPIGWQVADPDDEVETPSTFYCQNFTNRWQDFMNYIHKKLAAYQNKLAEEVRHGSNSDTIEKIKEKFPDPFKKYKDIFQIIFPEKELLDINPASPSEFKYKDNLGVTLPFSSLSSGEQEVIKVLFDVARKEIRDSVIIVDEPELHLHPTLTFKLVEALKFVGGHSNQFIFLTHSADLISTYYSTGNVYFIDSEQSGSNQAHRLSDLNHSHKELVDLIGENLGLFAVGKKLVFVEGEDSSIDRLVYHALAQKYLPEAKIIPVGSVENIIALNAFEKQIRKSIFGINLYMIRDRDGLSTNQITTLENAGKIKCLKKRHIENYFLDAEILFKVAQRLYTISVKPEITQQYIDSELKRIASEQVKLNLLQNTKEYIATNHNFNIPTIKSLDQKSCDDIIGEFSIATTEALASFSGDISQANVKTWMDSEKERLKKALKDDCWKDEFQGKVIFSKLCSDVLNEDKIKVKEAYIDIALKDKPIIFNDIKEILESFN